MITTLTIELSGDRFQRLPEAAWAREMFGLPKCHFTDKALMEPNAYVPVWNYTYYARKKNGGYISCVDFEFNNPEDAAMFKLAWF